MEDPRDPKGRKWIPMDEQAKRVCKWVAVEDLTKKTELNWILIGD